jgi:hypothetical protein
VGETCCPVRQGPRLSIWNLRGVGRTWLGAASLSAPQPLRAPSLLYKHFTATATEISHHPVVAAIACATVPARAHHSFTAEYDFSKTVTLHGTVVQFEFINPHGQITLDVKKHDGAVERWRIEVSNPNQLLREGWKKDVLKPGDQITVEAYRARDGAHTGNGRQFILPDGRTLSSPGGPDESSASTDKPTVPRKGAPSDLQRIADC